MNQREYAALLDDEDVTLEMQVVYMVFRRYVDYATGVVGLKRVVDYNEISQTLEWNPKPGSNRPKRSYKRGQIKRIIQSLVDLGVLVRLHRSGLREAMVFRLPLVVSDIGYLRGDEARHQRDTGRVTPENSDFTGAVGSKGDTSTTPEARHISDISANSLSGAGGQKFFTMRKGWQIADEDRLELILAGQGFSYFGLSEYDKGEVLQTFIDYWVGRQDKRYCQQQWEVRFAEHVAYTLRKRA